MKEIKLTQGLVALVDDEDYEWLNQWKWYALKSCNTYYATRVVRKNTICTRIAMHRLIMGNPPCIVDHVDTDGLHNYRSNLRECTKSQNGMNRLPNKNSIYKGVRKSPTKGKWRGMIQVDGKCICLGTFNTKKDVAIAYNNAAIKYFGEFARLNEL